MKKIIGVFLLIFILVSCNGVNSGNSVVQKKYGDGKNEIVGEEEPKSYEFTLDNLFKIEKPEKNSYKITSLEDYAKFGILTKTDRGFLFRYSYPEKENGEYTESILEYYAYFDEYTKAITKIYDNSMFDYPYEVVWKDKVYFVTAAELEDTAVMELSADGVKKILEIEGYNRPALTVTNDSLLIMYNFEGETYLKRVDLNSYEIKNIPVEKDKEFDSVEVISANEYNKTLCYCLGKYSKKDKKFQYELVEYSIEKEKVENIYPLMNGFRRFVFKDNVFVFDEINKDGEVTNYDVRIAKIVDKEFKEIESLESAYGFSESKVDKDYIYFVTSFGIYKLNTKDLTMDWVETRKNDFFAYTIEKEILVLTESADNRSHYEFRTFEELKERYGD